MAERVYKSKKRVILLNNGGKIVIYHKEVVAGYIKDLWFDKTSITKIFALKNLIQQYMVTYDRLLQMFIVYCEENNKPNMHFRMHESGIHYYDPSEDFNFVTTVADNRKHYSKRQIKASERVTEL